MMIIFYSKFKILLGCNLNVRDPHLLDVCLKSSSLIDPFICVLTACFSVLSLSARELGPGSREEETCGRSQDGGREAALKEKTFP